MQLYIGALRVFKAYKTHLKRRKEANHRWFNETVKAIDTAGSIKDIQGIITALDKEMHNFFSDYPTNMLMLLYARANLRIRLMKQHKVTYRFYNN